ncbi:MAG TPA: TolC family protein [Gemmataceae bacterium]|nr:TolC family protein [Gemmataceae bacterium]
MSANIRIRCARASCLWLCIIAFLALISGCNSIRPLSRANPVDAPAHAAIRAPRHGAILGAPVAESSAIVQAQFVDDAPPTLPPAGGLTFNEAVTGTLIADPRIRAGFELIMQARGDLVTSSLRPNPSVLVDGLMLPTRTVTPAQTSGPTQTDTFLSFPIDWFLFGKRAAAMASARIGLRQSESDYADLIRQRVLTCAIAFYDLVEAKELHHLAQLDLANLKKVEAITDKAFQAGNRTKVDLQRVRLDVLKSEQSVRDTASTVEIAKAKLRALLGRADFDPAFDVSANLDTPLTGVLLAVDQAYALAQDSRPDIESLRHQVAKAEADIVVEDRKRYPEVTPGFGYTRQFQGPALGQINADTWNVNLIATVPLFNRNQGNRLKAQSVAAQMRFNLDAALVDLRAEITQVYQELQTAEKNAQAIAQSQSKSAKDVLDAITQSYEIVGGRTYVEVLEAQRTFRDTNRAYISSRANYWRAVYRFSAAIGKQIAP